MAEASQHSRRIVVAGSTFGQMYLTALRRCHPDTVVIGLLARGSDRSQRIADAHGVPLLTSADDVPDDTDLVCVIVRADSIGGSGTTLAAKFLEKGISVLHELPASTKDVTTCLRAARRCGARFAVADLYHWLPAVRVFRAAARELLSFDRPLAIDAYLSIQPAYALARLLTEIGLSLRPVSLKPSQDGKLISGALDGTPVAVRYATVLDACDSDNDVRFPSVSVHTSTGTLTLAGVHGPVFWIPTLHLSGKAKNGTGYEGEGLVKTAASTELFRSNHTHAEIFTDLWPTAIASQITAMFDEASHADAQRMIQVARLWEDLTGGAEFPAAEEGAADSAQRVLLQDRLRAAAKSAVGVSHISEKDEDSR
ncbi:Gfo/Idh/MocA family oxidoreductase [uncultured Propionibacterium sp.]|uniref:Gfo/Idh/MocA family oxidoreductase n=1 Tax=uncultured Propionibacterium sp. TaxID=218066 RepID=UPI002930F93F|nr:Gfo/Idh/MocA family oxidoreductase [uncultured Propionibacterium sp.]